MAKIVTELKKGESLKMNHPCLKEIPEDVLVHLLTARFCPICGESLKEEYTYEVKKCSECGYPMTGLGGKYIDCKYCPNCGAKFEEGMKP